MEVGITLDEFENNRISGERRGTEEERRTKKESLSGACE